MTAGRLLGVVVNPIAGMGGRVGLHGTDGATLQLALGRGAQPVAAHRARRALQRIRALAPSLPILTVAGAMGSDHLVGDGWAVQTLARPDRDPTTAADTRDAVRVMAQRGATLVLFVGGDGTARDVVDVLGTALPVLGVPSGVKMHSGVFATTPEVAGDTAVRFATDPERIGCIDADVVDLVETRPSGPAAPRLFGVARVPNAGNGLARVKASTIRSDDADLAALGQEIAREMTENRLYLLGPGTTVAYVNAALRLPASPLGVDAVLNGHLVASDASEAQLLALLRQHRVATLVLGVVGGQGFLLGRGNQQISSAVLDAVGTDNVEILAARSKIAALDPPVLRVDLGDEYATAPISGYRKVRTGPRQLTVLKVMT